MSLFKGSSKPDLGKQTKSVTSVRSNSVDSLSPPNDPQIDVFVDIPTSNAYGVKQRLDKARSIREIIQDLSALMSDRDRAAIARYHLYMNGLQFMNEDRPLSTYVTRTNSTITVQRGEEYEFVLQKNPETNIFITDVNCAEAAKQMATVAYPKMKAPGAFDYSLFVTEKNITLQLGERILMAKLDEGQVLELTIKSKQKEQSASVFFQCTYSPFSEREKQRKALSLSGMLKKLGNKAPTWKKRIFILDHEKLQYFDPKNKSKGPLGTIYLDEITDVGEAKDCNAAAKSCYFEVKVPGRNLLMFTKEESEMNSWIQSIRQMKTLAKFDLSYANGELAPRVERIDGCKEPAKVGSITGPMNVRHLNHISQDWKWAGDISVFQMELILGKGVSGTVYKAKVRDAGFDVAIKVVAQSNAKIQAELEKEIGVLKQCKHQNIVAYYGTYTKQQELWIIMDYCGAGSLKDVLTLTGCRLDNEAMVRHVLSSTLKGLSHLHMKGILHLDIKSANILLTDEGDVKLADFGVSVSTGTHDSSTFVSATNYVGSPLFMSPEVIRKDKYNSASDIWSLGITIIEMVDGQPPNTDIDCIEMLPLIATRDPPTLKNPAGFSLEFNNLISCCLKKEPLERYTCQQLLTHEFMTIALPSRDCMTAMMKVAMDKLTSKRQKL